MARAARRAAAWRAAKRQKGKCENAQRMRKGPTGWGFECKNLQDAEKWPYKAVFWCLDAARRRQRVRVFAEGIANFFSRFGAFFDGLPTVYGGGKKAFTNRLRTVNEMV